ncbi:MAG TPA: hypothetical protein VGM96_10800 [Reyranella sp.]|jgi:hypothetical protein
MTDALYGYPVLHLSQPPRFKFGKGDGVDRMISHSGKFRDGWYGDHARLVCFDASPLLETPTRRWLIECGFLVMPIPMLATRAQERAREARTGRPRMTREIHAMNDWKWDALIDLLASKIGKPR